MKKIISALSILSIVFFQNISVYWYSQWEVNFITQEIQELPKWEKYIQTLDLFSEKYENNLNRATQIKSNITRVLDKYKDSNHKDIELVILILKYLDIKFQSIIDSFDSIDDNDWTNQEDTTEDNSWEIEEDKEDIIYTKEALYPWFSTNYEDDTPKTILAGKESFIYNGSLVANIEEIEVEKMEFTFEGSDLSNFKYGFKEAILYVEWYKAQTITSNKFTLTNLSQGILEFDSIQGVFLPKEEIEFRLALVPQEIWYEKLGKYIPEITVSQVKVTQWKWVISGADISMKTLSEWSEKFQISPVILNVSVENSLKDSSRATINISADWWKNTQNSSSRELKAKLESIKLIYRETYWDATFKIYNSDNSSNSVVWIKNGWYLEFDLSGLWNDWFVSSGSNESYDIQISAQNDSTISLDIVNKGIIYSVEWVDNANNLNANLLQSINLWFRKY